MKMSVSEKVAKELVGLNKKDLRIEYFRASGPGGQHRNKKDTAARITHIATGISSEATDSKSQSTNRKNAFIKLVGRLVEHFSEGPAARRKPKCIRTYHAERGVVKDHRTGVETLYKKTMDGDLFPFILASLANAK